MTRRRNPWPARASASAISLTFEAALSVIVIIFDVPLCAPSGALGCPGFEPGCDAWDHYKQRTRYVPVGWTAVGARASGRVGEVAVDPGDDTAAAGDHHGERSGRRQPRERRALVGPQGGEGRVAREASAHLVHDVRRARRGHDAELARGEGERDVALRVDEGTDVGGDRGSSEAAV